MIEVYACGSPNVMKVLFMLGETGLPYEVRPVNVAAGEQFDPGFRALNPNAKVPVIVDRDGPGGKPFTVFESGAILAYLAEKAGMLFGRDAAERSTILQWVMFQMSAVGPIFGQAVHFKDVAGAPAADYARTRFFTEASRLCEVLDGRLATSAYLGGEAFSIADIATYPWLWKYPKQIGIDLAGLPSLERWRAEMEARPGFRCIRDEAMGLFRQGLAQNREADPDGLDRFFLRGRWARKP